MLAAGNLPAQLPSTVFVIEAEDFDYAGGNSNPQAGVAGMDVNIMPYFGGAYDSLGATEDIDFVNGDGPDSDQYRTEVGADGDHELNIADNLGAAPGNGSGGSIPIAGNDRGSWTMTANFRIGWAAGGEWQNYTRRFPTNEFGGWWKVMAALSNDSSADGDLAGSLARVTSGWGTTTQTTEAAGSFSAPGSGGWGLNNLVPMKTRAGANVVIKLAGTNTVRFNLVSGDFDFLVFIPAPPPPPFVEGGAIESMKRSEVVLDWTLRDTDAIVTTNSIEVFLGNTEYTPRAAITNSATGLTAIHLDLTGTQFASGEHTWRITFTDSTGQSTTAEGKFTVNPYPTPGTFVIEAEDFNYSADNVTGGKTNPQAGVAGLDVNVMPYLGGAYDQLGAVEGVDYNNNDGTNSTAYRTEADANGENEINLTASNGDRYSNDRGTFATTSNYRIGWVDNDEWQNYTRTFPQGNFNVWAALSYDGRAPGQLNGSLDLVASNPAQTNQITQRLGTFSAPGSGGWGRNDLVPMKGTNGAVATVALGGVQTVRFNIGSGDFDYLLFVPATAGPGGDLKFTSIRKNANGTVTVEWTGAGVLQSATSVTGSYTEVPGATNPFTFTPTGTTFGRLIRR